MKTYYKRWHNSDLVTKMIKADYEGYEELHTFLTVLCKGDFYSVSLIQNGENRKAVVSQRKCDGYCYFYETVKVITFSSKEEGNKFYKTLKATEKTSKQNRYYYTLKGI